MSESVPTGKLKIDEEGYLKDEEGLTWGWANIKAIQSATKI